MNPSKLSVIYDKRQKDFVVKYPRRCDGHLAMNHLVGDELMFDLDKHLNRIDGFPYRLENFIQELERRGYDPKTLKFSIMKKAIILFIFTINMFIVNAQEIPDYDHSHKSVSDFANVMTDEQKLSLQTKLSAYEKASGVQIAVVTQNDLQGYEIESYANKLFNTWGIGNKDKNNGLLILISPDHHKWRIEVGYGLEASLPDGTCHRLSEEYFPHNFREQKYFEGVDYILDEFISIIGTTPQVTVYKKVNLMPVMSWIFGIVSFLVLAFISHKYVEKVQRIQREKEEAERQELLKIQREEEAKLARAKSRKLDIEMYVSKLEMLGIRNGFLDSTYEQYGSRTLNNEELYTKAKDQPVFEKDINGYSDSNIKTALKALNNTISFVDNSSSSIINNSLVKQEMLENFHSYSIRAKNLSNLSEFHTNSKNEFTLKYPNVYNCEHGVFNISYIEENIENGIAALNSDGDFISSNSFSRSKSIASDVERMLDNNEMEMKQFENLKATIHRYENAIKLITDEHLDGLFAKATDSIYRPHISNVTKRYFSVQKEQYQDFKDNNARNNLDIIKLAERLIMIESGVSEIPNKADKDIKEYHAEIKRKEEEEERRRRKRKQDEEDEERRRRNNNSSSYGSSYSSYSSGSSYYDSSSSSSGSSFDGGSSGGGGDSGGW